MESVKTYIESNKDRFLDELKELLRIPSVSANPDHRPDMQKMAEEVKNSLEKVGLENVEIMSTKGYPVVYGEKIINSSLPTVLVYGHYDVQPPDPLELWDSPPFEPVIKDGKIFARGACDDKGQAYMHVKAFECLSKLNALTCNIKFMIEGEEEVGSSNLGDFTREHSEKLKSDIILISDTSMLSLEAPSITTGLRGLSYLEVEVTGPNRDLHSGVYGGAVGNPINILAKVIGELKDGDNKVTVKGFYDDVEVVSEEERVEMAKAPFDLQAYKEDLNVGAVDGEEGYSSMERTSIRPSLDVNGMWGGYIGEGAKTVLPSKAYAKISMRLVPHQSSEKITKLFQEHIEAIVPSSVKVKVTPHHGGDPVVTPTNSIAYRAAEKAVEEAFGKRPIPVRSGGSIPIVALFKEVLEVDSLLLGFGLDTDAIHSPNEHFGVENYLKGIETISYFYGHFAELSKEG